MTFAYRQDFGFGNPNTAGAFFAVLLLAVFFIPPRNRWLGGLRIGLGAVVLSALLLTASRGALVALAAGSLAAWIASGCPRPCIKFLAACLLAVLLAVGIFGERSLGRLADLSPSEGSTTSRMRVYRAIPEMLVSAPVGWGWGKGAHAYENWFQSPADHTHLKNLLSTHATWIVEGGVPFALAYLMAWALAFLVCASCPLALGMLVAWAVATSFSHVGGAWPLWILPALAVVYALRRRSDDNRWPRPMAWGVATALATLSLSLLFTLGFLATPSPEVRFDGNILTLGPDAPKLWIFSPDVSVFGKTCGKPLRRIGSLAIVEKWEDVPPQATAILSGPSILPPPHASCREIRWINPPPALAPEFRALLKNSSRVSIFWGALRTDARPDNIRPFVESIGARWVVVPGKGRFLGDDLEDVTKL